MKKNYLIGISIFVCAFIISAVALFIHSAKVAYGEAEIGQQCQEIINAINAQATYKIETGDNAEVDADTLAVMSDKDLSQINSSALAAPNYPAKFDLRNCDLDGNGQVKNYVTSVKFQNPWGSCWAFAGIAASETSILSKLRTNSFWVDGSGQKHDSLDLSEHHLSWFNYSPMQAYETPTQAGEGAYSVKEETAKEDDNVWWQSQRMATGGVCMSTLCSFAMGEGVVREPDFNDPNVSPVIRQLLYKGINGTTMTTSKGFTVFSEDDDWSIDYSARFMQDYKLEEGNILPDSKTPAGQPYDVNHAKYVTKLMKQQLMQGHALNIAFKADNYSPKITTRVPKYINTDTWAHYTYEQVGASHDVTVIGWDDNYPKTNFLSEVPMTDEEGKIITDPWTGKPIMKKVPQPEENGAWIVKNSWGSKDSWGQGLNTSEWGIDNTGYFYISYYDRSLKSEESYDFDVSGTTAAQNITNQYDFMPCEATYGIEQSAPVSTANVFVAAQDQYVNEIGVPTNTENVSATFKLYKLSNKNQRIDEGELLCSVNQNYQFKGYHRVKLGGQFFMKQGDVFAVTMTQQSRGKYIMGVAKDANKLGYENGKAGDNYYCISVVNPGESFLYTSKDDKWTDFTVIKKQLEAGSGDAKYYTYDNFPIKAYATSAAVPQPQPSPDIPGGNAGDAPNTGDNLAIEVIALILLAAVSAGILLRKKNNN